MTPHAVVAVGERPFRDGSFDAAKALAMVAVIAGHTALRFLPDTSASGTVAFAFSFHMPLFFVVSGYFMRADGSTRVGKDVRSLLVPYFVTAFAVIAGLCASNLVLHDLGSTRELLFTWLNASAFAQGDMTAHPLWPQTARIGPSGFSGHSSGRVLKWLSCLGFRETCRPPWSSLAFLSPCSRLTISFCP